jgi:SAM-dependent methyltransferase
VPAVADSATLRPTVEEALAAYRAQVLANRAYIEALEGERPPGHDYWATRAASFRPGQMPTPELEVLLGLARAGETWIDIGAGAGRFAVPLAERVARVVAVEPSPAMRAELAEAARLAGRSNIEVVDLAWPPEDGARAPVGEVALAANVLYAIDDVGGFIEAMEAHARRACAVVAFDRAPNTPVPGLWRDLWGEDFRELPALREQVGVLLAMGRRLRLDPQPPQRMEPRPLEEIAAEYAWMYHVRPGLAGYEQRLTRFRELVAKHCSAEPGMAWPPVVRRYSSVISWPVE